MAPLEAMAALTRPSEVWVRKSLRDLDMGPPRSIVAESGARGETARCNKRKGGEKEKRKKRQRGKRKTPTTMPEIPAARPPGWRLCVSGDAGDRGCGLREPQGC